MSRKRPVFQRGICACGLSLRRWRVETRLTRLTSHFSTFDLGCGLLRAGHWSGLYLVQQAG